MLTDKQISTISRSQVVDTLALIREEWEEAACGLSLVECYTSLGFILVDLADGLGLTQDEQRTAFGSELYKELNTLLLVPNR